MFRWNVMAVVMATSLVASSAMAQTGSAPPFNQNIDMQQFHPAPGPYNLLSVHGARVDGNGTFTLGVWANYAWRPFTIFNASCPNAENDEGCTLGDVRSRPIEHMVSLDVLATVTVARRIQIGLTVPLAYESGQAVNSLNGYPLSSGESQSTFALGDPRLDVKIRIAGRGLTGMAAAIGLTGVIPTGQFTGGSNRFVANDSVALGGRGVLDGRFGRFFFALNAGVLWRPEVLTVLSTRIGTAFQWGAGAGFQATPRLGFVAEIFGSNNFSTTQQNNGVETDLAARYTLGDVSITAGGGAGIIRAAGTPVARGFVGLQWSPLRIDGDSDGVDDSVDRCPSEAEDRDGYDDLDGCPEDDNDGDGVPDTTDRCPDVPEDRDNFQDQDGCPDLDNDADGVPDGYDSCPREPEDRDGDHDEDGCPDNDRDHDGTPDDQDRCPTDPEDLDGFADTDGCPEPDNDHDGILDVNDQCSDQPETMNGHDDTDGCPDGVPDRDHDGVTDDRDRCPDAPETFNNDNDSDGCPESSGSLVSIQGTQLVITEPVNFELNSDRIVGGGSFRVLDSVVAFLTFQPNIIALEIQGHTDDRGDPAVNRELSVRRANAVKSYLVDHGVNAARLFSTGHGADRPLRQGSSSEIRALNRRVEFHILNRTAPQTVAAPPNAQQ
jgi:OmpA-OmpF porin, OOP family